MGKRQQPEGAISGGIISSRQKRSRSRQRRRVSKRSATHEEALKRFNQELAARLPNIEAEIDSLVDAIAKRVACLPADRLLHRAWWEFSATVFLKGVRDAEEAGSLRMIDYVQSIIASVPPAADQAPDVSEADWAALQADVQKLFRMLTFEYQWARTAVARASDPDIPLDVEEFRFRTETLWMHVRGKRYQAHEIQALQEILAPHSDELTKLFGIDATTLSTELGKLLHSLTAGAITSMRELRDLHQDSMPRLEEIVASGQAKSWEEAQQLLWCDPVFAERLEAATGAVFGLDLFDVGKLTNLPENLTRELTWAQGEERDFLAPGPMRGWPLRVWPTMKRPFIRLSGRTACFDVFSLFDNIYRVLQRTIFRLDPAYKQAWNERQKEVSEELPFRYLAKLLPGARIFRPVYYRSSGAGQKPEWCEADGLAIYDDHLFVIEVKGGAFTYTSPATDLPAHIASLRSLLSNPAKQGARFLQYLMSKPEVAVADADHQEIVRLRSSDFRQITILAITLDPFTELAARAQHLRPVGVDVGSQPVWPVSIDDLRVYADIFTNPLVFLHYVEQRKRAARCSLVDLSDEFDHLGLYLTQNDYARLASELVHDDDERLIFNGFRSGVDEFYSAVVNGESPAALGQQIPPRLAEAITLLARLDRPGRSRVASFLLDADGEQRDRIAAGIEVQLEGNRTLGRLRPLSSMGEHSFTLCCWSSRVPRDAQHAVDFTQAVAASNHERSRLLLEFEYDTNDKLVGIYWQDVGLAILSVASMKRVEREARKLQTQRLRIAAAGGKIRVNSLCPCGSGKKYKKCCRSRRP